MNNGHPLQDLARDIDIAGGATLDSVSGVWSLTRMPDEADADLRARLRDHIEMLKDYLKRQKLLNLLNKLNVMGVYGRQI